MVSPFVFYREAEITVFLTLPACRQSGSVNQRQLVWSLVLVAGIVYCLLPFYYSLFLIPTNYCLLTTVYSLTWDIYRSYLGHVCFIYGRDMGHLWENHGRSMREVLVVLYCLVLKNIYGKCTGQNLKCFAQLEVQPTIVSLAHTVIQPQVQLLRFVQGKAQSASK